MIEVKEGGHIHYGSHDHGYGYGGNWSGMIFGIIVLFLLLAVIAAVFNRKGGSFLGCNDSCDSVTPKEVLGTVEGFKSQVADKFCGVTDAINSVRSEIVLSQKESEIAALKDKISNLDKSEILCQVKSFVSAATEKLEDKIEHRCRRFSSASNGGGNGGGDKD